MAKIIALDALEDFLAKLNQDIQENITQGHYEAAKDALGAYAQAVTNIGLAQEQVHDTAVLLSEAERTCKEEEAVVVLTAMALGKEGPLSGPNEAMRDLQKTALLANSTSYQSQRRQVAQARQEMKQAQTSLTQEELWLRIHWMRFDLALKALGVFHRTGVCEASRLIGTQFINGGKNDEESVPI